MSAAELNTLEREVIAARARFAGDLARLRSPDTFADFKDDLVSTAVDVKDDLLSKAKESATEKVDGLVAELKGKANANPGAVLAIGAGLAWHFARRPPITSLLVGLGLWSLWRTPPAPEGEGFGPRSMELATAAKEKVEDWSEQAEKTVSQLADQAASTADQVSTSVRATVHDLQDAALAAAGRVKSAASDTASYIQREGGAAGEKASALLREHSPDEEARNGLLLGAAALAVTAAVGIAYQRRN
jgi:gas vesicle protein